MARKNEQAAIFRYGAEFSPVYSWFVPMGLIASLAVVLAQGISVYDGPGYFLMPHFFIGADQYTVDPLISTFIKNSTPLLLQIFAPVIDIPFYHLLGGIITKLVLVFVYYLLAWKMTRSTLASLIAVFILFGVADFRLGEYHILNLRLPIGFTSNELRMPLYLSFRQVGMVFALVSALFFLNKQFLLSSVSLAFGVYFHPLNSLGFFLCFNLALLICILNRENRMGFFYAMMKLSVPLLVIISPYVFGSMSVLTDVTPMSFSAYWDFLLKNEPDDASVLWYFRYFKSLYLAGFLLTFIAAISHIFFKARKPVQLKEFSVLSFKDMVVPLLVAPWVLLLFAVVWEVALIPLLPDFLNDTISTLNLKRITTVGAVVYIPILSMVVSTTLMLVVRTACREILSEEQVDKIKKIINKAGLASFERTVAVSVSIFTLCYVLLLDNRQIHTFKKFVNFDHVEIDYFLDAKELNVLPKGVGEEVSGIPLESLLDICDWVKNNTPVQAALIHPTYMKRVRVYCKRQAFLSEKEDGNFCLVNRKFATVYLKRFSDIHGGLTYDDLPGIVFEGGEAYAMLRKRYLSLSESDIDQLKKKYLGYDYFLTETSHYLDYPVLFENEFFRLYHIVSDL